MRGGASVVTVVIVLKVMFATTDCAIVPPSGPVNRVVPSAFVTRNSPFGCVAVVVTTAFAFVVVVVDVLFVAPTGTVTGSVTVEVVSVLTVLLVAVLGVDVIFVDVTVLPSFVSTIEGTARFVFLPAPAALISVVKI
jgi:hypothetical protein